MSICILDPGPLTTVQDLGRSGSAADGYRSCGAADSYSARLANLLVGNAAGDAVLETTLRGPELRFEIATVFALTGAEAPAQLDGQPVRECRLAGRRGPGDQDIFYISTL